MSSAEELIHLKRTYLVEQLSRLECEDSLHEFVKQAWHILEPHNEFIDGWHIKAICEHLEAVARGEVRNLIINVPPGTCKSTLVSVMWPAWTWIKRPWTRFLFASHSNSLSVRDSIRCRLIIESDWYQNRWADTFALTKFGEDKFENNATGFRQATSVGSKVTGARGDIIVGDDLNDTLEVLSDTVREKTNLWYSTAFSSRLNDIKTGCTVIMMQRCHTMDVTGYILNSDMGPNFVKIILPMKFRPLKRCTTIPLPSCNNEVWKDPRTKDDELLWPEKFGPDEVKRRAQNLKSVYNISGQEQQEPSPEEGGIIRKAWFQWWKEEKPPEKLQLVFQSWDTALEAGELNAYSVCSTWGIFTERGRTKMILLSLWRERAEFPELRVMAQRLAIDYRDTGHIPDLTPDGKHVPDYVLIEQKASGHSLIHELRKAGVRVFKFDPRPYGDKLARVRVNSCYIEDGLVVLPARPPEFTTLRAFAQIMLDECIQFPMGEFRDCVDTLTQAIIRLKITGFLKHSKDRPIDVESKPASRDLYGPGEVM